jgi:hypothetical protein
MKTETIIGIAVLVVAGVVALKVLRPTAPQPSTWSPTGTGATPLPANSLTSVLTTFGTAFGSALGKEWLSDDSDTTTRQAPVGTTATTRTETRTLVA